MNKHQAAIDRIQKVHDKVLAASGWGWSFADGRIANRDRAELLTICTELQAENDALWGLLSAARCPNRDGTGAYMTHHGPAQCQWCAEKGELLNKEPNK